MMKSLFIFILFVLTSMIFIGGSSGYPVSHDWLSDPILMSNYGIHTNVYQSYSMNSYPYQFYWTPTHYNYGYNSYYNSYGMFWNAPLYSTTQFAWYGNTNWHTNYLVGGGIFLR